MYSIQDRLYDLSMIWSKVNAVFPYFHKLSFDWDASYHAYIQQVLEADNEHAFHDLLTQFVDQLGDGHTKYLPPLEYRKSKPFVPPPAPSFTRSDDGVLTIKINDFLHDYSQTVQDQLSQAAIQSVRIDVSENIGGNTLLGAKIAELFISGEFSACQKWTRISTGNDAASASIFADESPESIRQYIEMGLCTEAEVIEAQKILTRQNFKHYMDHFGSPTHLAQFSGPVKLIISRKTISAAEDFVAMFKSNHRATIIGEPTAGTTGTPYQFDLRCGGRAQVVSVGYKLLDGTDFIGIGIQPD